MPETANRRNAASLGALLLPIAALSVNFVFFVNPPLQAALPWLGLALAIAALAALAIALWRALAQSHIYRGKVLSIVLGAFTLLFSGANLFIFYHSRTLPNSAAAPQVGQ
jgi:uncharacterized membrane protein HdeD (DUF308 family)